MKYKRIKFFMLFSMILGLIAFMNLNYDNVSATVSTSGGKASSGGGGGYQGANDSWRGGSLSLGWKYGDHQFTRTLLPTGAGMGSLRIACNYSYGDSGAIPQSVTLTKNASGKYAYMIFAGSPTFTGQFAPLNTSHYAVWPLVTRIATNYGNPSGGDSIKGEYVDEIIKNHGSKSGGAYWIGSKRVDGVGIDAHIINVPSKPETKDVTTITKTTGVPNPVVPTSNSWMFDHIRTTAPYGGKTKDKQYAYSNKITVTVSTIRRSRTLNGYPYWSDQEDPKTETYSNTTYKVISNKTYTTTFNYHMTQPDPITMTFAPFNLNKATGTGNGAMTSAADTSLIKSYLNDYNGPKDGKAMDVVPDNRENITDGAAIKTLDTNAATKFNVKWNNAQFGVPTNELTILDEKPTTGWTWQNAVTGNWDANGKYNKGKTNLTSQKTNTQYHNGVINAGVSSNNSSLAYNGGKETIGPNAITLANLLRVN